jgi:formiminotetrahydrofolate cyclodeaminase
MSSRNKAEKFVDLANKRVNKAIKDIRLVANLANKANYEYSDDQAKKIISALQKELDNIKDRFKHADSGDQSEFSL